MPNEPFIGEKGEYGSGIGTSSGAKEISMIGTGECGTSEVVRPATESRPLSCRVAIAMCAYYVKSSIVYE